MKKGEVKCEQCYYYPNCGQNCQHPATRYPVVRKRDWSAICGYYTDSKTTLLTSIHKLNRNGRCIYFLPKGLTMNDK